MLVKFHWFCHYRRYQLALIGIQFDLVAYLFGAGRYSAASSTPLGAAGLWSCSLGESPGKE